MFERFAPIPRHSRGPGSSRSLETNMPMPRQDSMMPSRSSISYARWIVLGLIFSERLRGRIASPGAKTPRSRVADRGPPPAGRRKVGSLAAMAAGVLVRLTSIGRGGS